MPWLIIERGPERGTTIEVTPSSRVVFGRDESCDVVTADVSCSRRHFGLGEKNGAVILRDLDSTHGTFVNGWRVDKSKLKDGDTITAGETVISFQVEKAGRGLVGKVLGGYQVLDRIGRGGMGTVYQGKQIALDRLVALKVLSPRYSNNKTFINRFFKEAQAAARLNHPNVVQVYDVREEQGLYVISLEYMDSGTVQDLAAEQGQLPIGRVLEIARDAAQGLVYAEKKQIVHGDIKPDNLMINADGHIKISDLGLARDAGEMASQGEEGIFGTPHFIPPEQALGKAVDSRSDIYSLGATLYRLVCGTTPFSGSSVSEIIKKQINDEPLEMRELRQDCPQDLADLVSVMMAKDPSDRFATAEELLQAIDALGTTGRIQKGSSAGVKGIVAVAIVLVVALLAIKFFPSGSDNPEDEPEPGSTIADGNDNTQNTTGNSGNSGTDPNLEREKLELAVRRKLILAEEYMLRLGRDGKDDDVDSLKRGRELFVQARDTGPDTESGRRAKSEIEELDAKIATIRAAEAARAAEIERNRLQADGDWAALEKKTRALLAADNFGDALTAVMGGKDALADTHRAADWQAFEKEVRAAARTRADAIHTSVDAAIADKDFAKARELLEKITKGFNPSALDGETFGELNGLIAFATERGNQLAELERTEYAGNLVLDQKLVFTTMHDCYRTLETSFDVDGQLAAVEAAHERTLTPPYRRLLGDLRDQLGRVAAFKARVVAGINDGSRSLRLSGRGVPSGDIIAAAADKLTVRKRSGGEEDVEWSAIDAKITHRFMLRKSTDDPRDAVDAVLACVLCGLLEEAEEALADLGSEPPAELADAVAMVTARVRREAEAQAELDRIHETWGRAETETGAWFELLGALKAFVGRFADTRVFVVNSDGSTPLVPHTP